MTYKSDILLITPPFTQLNTPYPATAYLKGFLNTKGISSFQIDLGLETVLKIFTKEQLKLIFNISVENKANIQGKAHRIMALQDDYIYAVDIVISFLQGKEQSLAHIINSGGFLPHGPRFDNTEDFEWAFGVNGIHDKARYLATLFLEDLSDFIIECVDHNFGFSRYAEKLGICANSFDELYQTLHGSPSIIDNIYIQLLHQHIVNHKSGFIAFSVPFPGNLYGALRCAKYIKENFKDITTIMGGGFPNTELRSLADCRVFDFFDFITLDDGALPLELIVTQSKELKRTYLCRDAKLVFSNAYNGADYKPHELGTPDYSDLWIGKYISVIEMANPMHNLWSNGRWNKLTMAHGCYWAKCSFCDTKLNYIHEYIPLKANIIADQMEQIIKSTGERGFHFVDEAAPPALMKALALEILKRGLVVSWWTNIRFEKAFTFDVCQLLKASGCIAVAGGLEVAGDRLLKLINKGVTVAQVARAANNFTQAGIMVHAYLMYGFPSQTAQETIDSLEMVRQMFEAGIVQSGFWHRFALTAHSSIIDNCDKYGVTPRSNEVTFANNEIAFDDKTGIDHEIFSFGLKKSLFNFMHHIGFDFPLQEWFECKIPKTRIKRNYIISCVESQPDMLPKPESRLVWLGSKAFLQEKVVFKKGKNRHMYQIVLYNKNSVKKVKVDKLTGEWIFTILDKLSAKKGFYYQYSQFKEEFESEFTGFDNFWESKAMQQIRLMGLLVI